MKQSIFLFALFFSYISLLCAQTYRPVSDMSSVKVVIKNVGMEVDGNLSGLEGDIRFNPSDLKGSVFSVSVDAGTINTGIDVRDENLRTDEYLNTKKYPRINFVSKQVMAGGKPNTYMVKGTLTMKGISKEISIPFIVTPKNEGLLFTGEFRVNRRDFKIGIDSVVLSESMTVLLVVFGKKD